MTGLGHVGSSAGFVRSLTSDNANGLTHAMASSLSALAKPLLEAHTRAVATKGVSRFDDAVSINGQSPLSSAHRESEDKQRSGLGFA